VLRELIARSEKAYSVLPASRFVAPTFFGFAGLVFLGTGMKSGLTNFASLLGIGFVVFAVAVYLFSRRAYGTGKGGG
jgi:hypothetical protein